MSPFTYPEADVGATRDGPLPAGYRQLVHRVRLGHGVMPVATEALLGWRLHHSIRVPAETSAPRAAAGVRVTSRIGLGPLRVLAPCQVVWVEEGADRAGFGYGTLPGHPASGEESFVVSRDPDGTVWFTVTSFSRPVRWFMRAAGPAAPLLQRVYARDCGRTLRRLCQRSSSN